MSEDLLRRIESLERKNRSLERWLGIACIALTVFFLLWVYHSTQLSNTRNLLQVTQTQLLSQELKARASEMEAQNARDRAERAKSGP